MRQPSVKIEPDAKKIVTEFLRSGRMLEEFDCFYTKCVEEPILKLRKPKPNQYQGIAISNPFQTLTYGLVGRDTHLCSVQTCSDFSSVVWKKTYNQR